MISKWNYLPLTSNEQQIARTLGDRYPKVPALCKLLAQRGVTSAAEAEKFFKPQLSDLHDPFLMRDMEKAVVRLNRALGSKEKIMIYGDYDVDGTTAVSLVYKFLQIRDSTTISPTVMKRDTVFPTKVSTMPPKTVSRCSSLSTVASKP